MSSRLLKMVSLLVLMVIASASAQSLYSLGYDSVYYSKFCRENRCVLEQTDMLHNYERDHTLYTYRLKDRTILKVARFLPFNPGEYPLYPRPGIASISVRVGKWATPAQLEQALIRLVYLDTGKRFKRLPFDFAHKCVRPGQDMMGNHGRTDRWNAMNPQGNPMRHTLADNEITCIWTLNSWRLYINDIADFLNDLGWPDD